MSDFSQFAVLHVALNPVTGPWSVMRDLAVAQAKSGLYGAVGLGVITPKDWPSQYAEELRQTGLPAYRANTIKAFGTAQFLWQRLQRPPIKNWVNDLMFKSGAKRAVVHFHNAWMSGVFLPLRESSSGQIKTVATFHGVNAMLEGKPVRHFLHRWMAARLPCYGAWLTSVDRGNLVLAEKILGLRPDLFTVIPNGVADDPTLRATAWNGEGEFRVGHVGSITERKGWRIGAEAVLRLAAEGKRVRYIIAGNGPEAGQAEALGREHPEVIEYLGHVPQPRRNLLPKLHALSVMSAHEGLPMTIIEALSVGLPVLATSVGGIPEAVQDGVNGRLIPRNVEALTKSILRLYNNPAEQVRFCTESRRVFCEKFEISKMVELYDAVYTKQQ
jgi:glycosyltransferase involved in cell wall biosynthesis